jgi:pimeloyl-ACP methyl ester carboxylesterase
MARLVRFCALAMAACTPKDDPQIIPDLDGPVALFSTEAGAGFWEAPWPAEHRRHPDGTVDAADFPNPDGVELIARLTARVDGIATGFGQSSGVYLPFSRSLAGAKLPESAEITSVEATVFLVDVDPDSPERGLTVPIEAEVIDGDGPFDPDHGLVLLPIQGLPLRPDTRYAAGVRRSLTPDAPLVSSDVLDALVAGGLPEGWTAEQAQPWLESLDVLRELEVDPSRLGALTVFTTQDATRDVAALVAAGEAGDGISLVTPFSLIEQHDTFCAYQARVLVPIFQAGEAPYRAEGGGLVREEGVPVQQGSEQARLFLTVPRRAQTAAAWPTVVFARTGGGGDRPLLDRGVRVEGGEDVPGTGFAVEFARAGVVGVQLDGPLGGIRNPDGADEQLAIFNITNPDALLGNLQQSAAELAWLPALLEGLLLDLSACPGTEGPSRLDAEELVLFGHSMGATIGPVAAALQPRYRALVLSGAGGSWIHNVVLKEKPLPVRGIAATILQEPTEALDRWHPALSLLQWAGEGADPPLFGPVLRADGGRHVLMIQGILDRYILPPIAQATALSLHLDLAGEDFDATDAPQFAPYADVMPWVGAVNLPLPTSLAQGTEAEPRTAVVVQHLEDGVEDGHEVAYQLPQARRQVQCFVESWVAGSPQVVAADPSGSDCPRP